MRKLLIKPERFCKIIITVLKEEKIMSKKHPVVAITGSSGAGTSTVKNAFNHIFINVGANPVIIEGDSFHRYDREENDARHEEERKNWKQTL